MSNLEKAENFQNKVKKLVNTNYNTLEIAKDFSNGNMIRKGSNSIISSVFIRPNTYNTHMESDEIRKQVEEIASIATGRKATSLTDMRKAREESQYDYSPYNDNLKLLKHSAGQEFPVYEIEYKYANF